MVKFHTFDDYVSVLSIDAPHALVQEWWSRLEREVKKLCKKLGHKYNNSVSEMINALDRHPAIDTKVIEELHSMRRTRNAVAHDLDVPSLTVDQAEQYARRAFALGWDLSELS